MANTKDTEEKSNVLNQIIERQEVLHKENVELRKKLSELEGKQSLHTDEIIDTQRNFPTEMTLVSYNGKPVLDVKQVTKYKKVDGQIVGEYQEATCTVYGMDKPFITTFGDINNPEDYLNLPRLTYTLTDQADLSGASKIEANVPVKSSGLVEVIDRSSGEPVPTGKKIQQNVYRDIRWYTVLVDGEKVVIHEDKLYR